LDSTNDTVIVNEADEFGDGFKAHVQLVESTIDERKRITVRKLLMTVNDESRIVWHLLFSGWPDFGVPEGDDRLALSSFSNCPQIRIQYPRTRE
jgi:protein-tyrosine phosphatase